MADRWLSLAEAAKRVRRATSTIYRWIGDGKLRAFDGRVRESHVVELDRQMRARVGRPKGKATTVPLVMNGQSVGQLTISSDGSIVGRIGDTPKT